MTTFRLPRALALPGLPARTWTMHKPGYSIRARIALACAGLFLLVGSILIAATYSLVGRISSQADIMAEVAVMKSPSLHKLYLECHGANSSQFRQDPGFANECRKALAFVARASAVDQALADRQEFLLYSTVGLAITTALAGGLGWVVSSRVLKPVRALTDAARRASEENLNLRLALAGPHDELKELADTFDDMLARLDAAFASQRRFVANASHELRTPLTEMRTVIDVTMAKPERSVPQLESVVTAVRAAVQKSDALIEALLTLARSDRGLGEVEIVDLPTAVEDAVDAVGAAAAARQVTIETELGDASTTGDRVLLDRLVTNLVDNAVRHNEPRGWVRISTTRQNGSCRVSVANGGPLIPAESVPGLTEPFRRLAGRIGDYTGCGLGLSIVASVVSAHGGRLELTAPSDGGLTVDVVLPAAK